MPLRALRPCKQVGCPQLTRDTGGYCEDHIQLINDRSKQYDRTSRPDYHAWYSSDRWRKARINYLHKHPLCVSCEKHDVLRPAIIVDHTEPHKGNLSKFWDSTNWQPLCKCCHDRKTAREDGGFGNRRKKGR